MARRDVNQSAETTEEMPEIDLARWKAVGRGIHARQDRKLTLSVLRHSRGLTQEQVAKRAKLSQSEVSRAELRENCLVSTLARYAKALGGELLLYVQIDGRKYGVALSGQDKAGDGRVVEKRSRSDKICIARK